MISKYLYLPYFLRTVKYRLFLKIQAEGDSDLLLGSFTFLLFSCFRLLSKQLIKSEVKNNEYKLIIL